jgi:hypothetical protein
LLQFLFLLSLLLVLYPANHFQISCLIFCSLGLYV